MGKSRSTSNGEVIDLTRGGYRKKYSGYLRGKRINQISLNAEAWFWRIDAKVDDFGNITAHPVLLHGETAGLRAGDVSAEDVAGWVVEMVKVELVRRYEVAGEQFIHIVGFTALQKPLNGRRARRYPPSPWDEDDLVTEAGGIPVKPGETGCYQSQDQDQDQDQDPPAGAGEASAPPSREPDAAPSARGTEVSVGVVEFRCVGKPFAWTLTADHLAELIEQWPGTDVRACLVELAQRQTREARLRRSARGMPAYLQNWLRKDVESFKKFTRPAVGVSARTKATDRAQQMAAAISTSGEPR